VLSISESGTIVNLTLCFGHEGEAPAKVSTRARTKAFSTAFIHWHLCTHLEK
jgi:hypothetical protein